MSKEENIIDIEDYRGRRVIFTWNKWKEKSIMHPELRNKIFLRNIKRVIENPTEVWQDYSDKKNKRCYYWKYSTHTYIKVVIWVSYCPCYIVTAYQINYIKEKKYPELKRLK